MSPKVECEPVGGGTNVDCRRRHMTRFLESCPDLKLYVMPRSAFKKQHISTLGKLSSTSVRLLSWLHIAVQLYWLRLHTIILVSRKNCVV